MQLPKLAIKNYQFTLTLFSALILFGTWSYFNMPRMENPSIFIPGGSVTVIYPGASPSDLEQLVAIPIEEAINELDDIKKINTTIIDGLANIAVEFNYETNAKEKYDDLISQVNGIKNELPEEILDIQMMRWTSSDVNILQYALLSNTEPYPVLQNYAETFKKEVERSFGIRKVEIRACPDREVRIYLDLETMSQLNLGINQVIEAVKSNNANIPGGNISVGSKNFSIKTSGSYNSLDEIRNTIVHSYNGKIIYLKDIAIVEFTNEDINYHARVNSTRAVFVTVQQKENINIFHIMDDLNPLMAAFEKNLPETITPFVVFNQSEIVDTRINGFLMNLLQGIALVGVIIMLALGFRSSLIVIFSIPFSIVIGLGFVDLGNYGLQQISIAGLVVALGLLVDNSIVMIENIARFRRAGESPKNAAIKGAQQIGSAVVSATITTLLAFIPLILMPDKAGDFIKSLPVTIIATLVVSLLIALAITPLASTLLLKKPVKEKQNFFNRSLQKLIEGPYRNTLRKAQQKPWLTVSFAVASFIIAVALFFVVGISFFPKAEQPQFLVRINLPDGTSLEKTDEVTKKMEERIRQLPGLAHYASNIGHGNPRIYYNTFTKSYNKNFAEIFVQLKTFDPDPFYALIDSLRDEFTHFAGAKINIKEFEQGIPTTAPVEIYLIGKEPEMLKEISLEIEQAVKTTAGAINIENHLQKTKTDLFVRINKEKAGIYGVPVHEIEKTIRASINGLNISHYRDSEGEEYNIMIRQPANEANRFSDFDRIYVQSLAGKMIPLSQLARIEFQESPGVVTRYNLTRNASITADLRTDYTLDEVLNPIMKKIQQIQLPPGYKVRFMGEYEARNETFGGMTQAIFIAILLIMSVLVLQFRSFSQPWIIFSAIPLSALGSVLALYITNNTFSFTAFVGFISLVGIVINNSIILVDYTNQLRADGKPMKEAIRIAGETRFNPIILTTLTTIGGLLPLTLRGGTLWAPMGWVIIGGLLVSTFLTLIVVPVLYQLFER